MNSKIMTRERFMEIIHEYMSEDDVNDLMNGEPEGFDYSTMSEELVHATGRLLKSLKDASYTATSLVFDMDMSVEDCSQCTQNGHCYFSPIANYMKAHPEEKDIVFKKADALYKRGNYCRDFTVAMASISSDIVGFSMASAFILGYVFAKGELVDENVKPLPEVIEHAKEILALHRTMSG